MFIQHVVEIVLVQFSVVRDKQEVLALQEHLAQVAHQVNLVLVERQELVV